MDTIDTRLDEIDGTICTSNHSFDINQAIDECLHYEHSVIKVIPSDVSPTICSAHRQSIDQPPIVHSTNESVMDTTINDPHHHHQGTGNQQIDDQDHNHHVDNIVEQLFDDRGNTITTNSLRNQESVAANQHHENTAREHVDCNPNIQHHCHFPFRNRLPNCFRRHGQHVDTSPDTSTTTEISSISIHGSVTSNENDNFDKDDSASTHSIHVLSDAPVISSSCHNNTQDTRATSINHYPFNYCDIARTYQKVEQCTPIDITNSIHQVH